MKRILFRGKQLGTGEWVEGSLIVSGGRCFILSQEDGAILKNSGKYGYWSINKPCSEVDPETVGQFTGILDKNGKQVFEGDKVQYGNNQINVVVWNEKAAMFNYVHELYTAKIEIIGNIHDK